MEKVKIAATGTTGTIGSQLPTEVISLKTRLEAPLKEKILELKKINPTAVIHLAGMVEVHTCEENPELCFRLNVDGALSWLQAAQQCGVQRFIFASTSHVYAKSDKPLPTSYQLDPQGTYGKSKLEAEKALQQMASNGATQIIIARIFSVLDENSKPGFLLPSLIRRAKERDYSPIQGLSSIRDFLTSSEVAAQLWTLTQAKSQSKIVNICSGKPTKILDLAKSIFLQYGADPSRLCESTPSARPFIVGEPAR